MSRNECWKQEFGKLELLTLIMLFKIQSKVRLPGQVLIDTGARLSVASDNLKKILEFHGCKFKTLLMDFSLADGSRSVKNCLTTTCKIEIGKRNFDIQFIVLPDAKQNRTLLGVDFLETAGIVLNMP